MLPHAKEADLLTLAVGAGRHPGDDRARAVAAASAGRAGRAPRFGRGLRRRGPRGERRGGRRRASRGSRGPLAARRRVDALPQLIGGALAIALVAFAEAIGPAEEFAREHGGKIDPNRELIALGAANTGAGLFSGFPIGSSLSKSAANDRAGAKTPASLITAAAATALVALFLTPLFEPLPEATLGAIVVVAVAGMMKVGKMRRLWRLRRARLLARVDRSGGRPRHADPAGAGDRRPRLARYARVARQSGAPDLPRPGARRPRAGGLDARRPPR